MSTDREIQEVIEKKVIEIREFVKGLPEEIQYEAAYRIQSEAETLALFSVRHDEEEKPVVPKIKGNLQVSDFVPPFIEKLLEQLSLDYDRWGNTWLKRPKEGQELRTKARYADYFDMFEQADIPVPWLKIVGGALICWIREQYPELCPDVNEVIADDMKAIGLKPFPKCMSETPVPAEHVEERGGLIVMKDDPPDELIGISVSSEGVKDITVPAEKPILHDLVPVEEMTTKELIESEPPIIKQADALTNPIAHIANETVEKAGLGKLSYAPQFDGDGKLLLESIVFTKVNVKEYPNEVVTKLGTCDKDGCITPTSLTTGVVGRVSSNGQYRLTLVKGVGPDDTIFVSYDYEYNTPT